LSYLEIKNSLPKNVNLLAVSKGFQSADIEYIHSLGQVDFGESKVQEALTKSVFNNKNLNWHFIGRIQSNKIRKIVENFDCIHSVDSYEKLLKISKVAIEINKRPNVMLQIKLADDPSKGGMSHNEIIDKWDQIKNIDGIKIIGLMTINPKGLTSNENLRLFKKCRLIADHLNLPECSMGMSKDWEQAIEAGSTWLRLGSIIFGERFS
tara:strand:+ start:1347 stop:1970 length:624 start_codon:yes stop_codon:yes gene_type:complete